MNAATGDFVQINKTGPVRGVITEDLGAGMVVVRVVLAEWMVTMVHPDTYESVTR